MGGDASKMTIAPGCMGSPCNFDEFFKYAYSSRGSYGLSDPFDPDAELNRTPPPSMLEVAKGLRDKIGASKGGIRVRFPSLLPQASTPVTYDAAFATIKNDLASVTLSQTQADQLKDLLKGVKEERVAASIGGRYNILKDKLSGNPNLLALLTPTPRTTALGNPYNELVLSDPDDRNSLPAARSETLKQGKALTQAWGQAIKQGDGTHPKIITSIDDVADSIQCTT